MSSSEPNSIYKATSEGVGSAWNVGSWHWEQKNVTKAALEHLTSTLPNLSVSDDKIKVALTSLPLVKCDASINIRRGKKIPTFELTIGGFWQGTALEGLGELAGLSSGGEIGLFNVISDDVLTGSFDIKIAHTKLSDNVIVDALSRHVAVTLLVPAVKDYLKQFYDFILSLGGTVEEIEKEKAKRLDEANKMQAAIAANAQEKERLAEVVRAKEQSLRESATVIGRALKEEVQKIDTATGTPSENSRDTSAHLQNVQNSAPDPSSDASNVNKEKKTQSSQSVPDVVDLPINELRLEPAGVAPATEASVWNKGDWMWETLDMSQWARQRLKEVVSGFDIDCPGARIHITEVDNVTGDASVVVRKGKHFVIFDFSFNAVWEGQLFDSNGNVIGRGMYVYSNYGPLSSHIVFRLL